MNVVNEKDRLIKISYRHDRHKPKVDMNTQINIIDLNVINLCMS